MARMMLAGLIVSAALFMSAAVAAPKSTTKIDDLPRRADWQAVIAGPASNPWAEVRSVEDRSPAKRAGLREGDHITHINGVRIETPSGYADTRRATRGGTAVKLTVEREGQSRDLKFKPRKLALESSAELEVTYAHVNLPAGYRQRTIVTKPVGGTAEEKLPSLMLIPWLSCASMEVLNKDTAGMDRLLAGILRTSGFLTMRVDKPGVGDSEGPGCSQSDLKTEIAGLLAALEQLKAHPNFDPDRLFMMGMSLGGGMAPVIAQDEKVRGYVSIAGVLRTWYEHMLANERRRLALSGKTAGEINDAMSGYAALYAEYLIAEKSPAVVLEERPELKPLWTDEPAIQYGRPAAFYSQLQKMNFEAAWEKVGVPTLIVAGEYDWIMTQSDYDEMAALVNANTPGAATLVRWPRASHEMEQFSSPLDAFNEKGGSFDDSLVAVVVDWLKRQN